MSHSVCSQPWRACESGAHGSPPGHQVRVTNFWRSVRLTIRKPSSSCARYGYFYPANVMRPPRVYRDLLEPSVACTSASERRHRPGEPSTETSRSRQRFQALSSMQVLIRPGLASRNLNQYPGHFHASTPSTDRDLPHTTGGFCLTTYASSPLALKFNDMDPGSWKRAPSS
ncbi:hypothetical protein GQ53DRAFT_748666 [Thozetella sp. PMI_491]|nr:hypothetical protein GQ53DRAFT_748666 [Thozetella sp. PMI_491]